MLLQYNLHMKTIGKFQRPKTHAIKQIIVIQFHEIFFAVLKNFAMLLQLYNVNLKLCWLDLTMTVLIGKIYIYTALKMQFNFTLKAASMGSYIYDNYFCFFSTSYSANWTPGNVGFYQIHVVVGKSYILKQLQMDPMKTI